MQQVDSAKSPSEADDVGKAPTRRSTRDIKRRKFDDEVVESDLLRPTKRQRVSSISDASDKGAADDVASVNSGLQAQQQHIDSDDTIPQQHPEPGLSSVNPKLPKSNTATVPIPASSSPVSLPDPPRSANVSATATAPATKTRKRGKTKKAGEKNDFHEVAVKNVGRWLATDDLSLITAVLQANDLSAVHMGVKFSCKFTISEIHERWYALLYDKAISKAATEAIRELPPEIILSTQSKTLFSKTEEDLLKNIPSTSQGLSEEFFGEYLRTHGETFHPARTAKSLLSHWQNLKQHRLLCDQSLPPSFDSSSYNLSISDIEESVNEMSGGVDLQGRDSVTAAVEQELDLERRQMRREMKHLETEIPRMQAVVEHITGICAVGGISPPDFDPQTLGVLRGRMVRYLMRSREITLGRNTDDHRVDIDVSLEGPAWKVSRRQGTIKLRATGEFFISNDGKRPIYIDGNPLLIGEKTKLNHNSVLEIASLRFSFLINQELISQMREGAAKMMAVLPN